MFDTYKAECGNLLVDLSNLTELLIVKNAIDSEINIHAEFALSLMLSLPYHLTERRCIIV